MSESMQLVMPDRMCRQARVADHGVRRAVLLWGGALGLSLGLGWWWRASPVYGSMVDTRSAVLSIEQRLDTLKQAMSGQPGPTPNPITAISFVEKGAPTSDDDMTALVRWHELLREHALRDWQGRSVPAPSTSVPAGSGTVEGAVWRLEGLATYEQGVALLNAMVRRFPRMVLLQVNVQQLSATELLQWRLELRWSAPVPALDMRWPTDGLLKTDRTLNPFAQERLPDVDTQAIDDKRRRGPGGPNHVLPTVPWRDIRLIGVVGQAEDRMALVTWTMASEAAPGVGRAAGRASRVSAIHWLRTGQTLGVEQKRVLAIEPRAVVLQTSRHAGSAAVAGQRDVLALADYTADHPTTERLRP